MVRQHWYDFDNIDAPEWLGEEQAARFCGVLNAYIPREYSTHGTRYHVLSRYPSGRLFFHLLNRPNGV